jgi:hypothetical protein
MLLVIIILPYLLIASIVFGVFVKIIHGSPSVDQMFEDDFVWSVIGSAFWPIAMLTYFPYRLLMYWLDKKGY